MAFSPGFMAPAGQMGSPRIFVSHGTRDGVLPIDRCSRKIVPQLEHTDYDVLYREFDGGHTISPEIALEAVGWFTQDKSL
jgi:phospholipase/carboxylesterase